MARPKGKTSPNAAEVLRRQSARSPQFASMYANDIQLLTSAWDVRMTFGEVAAPANSETRTVLVTEVGEVRMSPQLAKRVVAILAEQLREYEAQFGPIPTPDIPSDAATI